MRGGRTFRAAVSAGVPAVLLILVGGGCMSPFDTARRAYYEGRPEDAIQALNNAKIDKKDRVLFLMERGTLYQAAGRYRESTADFNAAKVLLDEAETHSASRAATSMVVNDSVLVFRGYPYERTYLHVMGAISYLADGNFQDAAVEARRIINTLDPDTRGDFPDDPFSHYLAGFCLELVGDSNSRLEYKLADKTLTLAHVTPTGQIYPIDEKKPPSDPGRTELVCLLLLGKAGRLTSSTTAAGTPPRVELSYDGKPLGKAFPMTDIRRLAAQSEIKLAAKKAAKTAARVVTKDAIADEVSRQNDTLGAILWITLMALEQPDVRHWETLPRFFEVARVPCPESLDYVDLKIRSGGKVETFRVTDPIRRKGRIYMTFKRTL